MHTRNYLAKEREVRVGKLHSILTDGRLDTRDKAVIPKNFKISPLSNPGEVWDGNKKYE